MDLLCGVDLLVDIILWLEIYRLECRLRSQISKDSL